MKYNIIIVSLSLFFSIQVSSQVISGLVNYSVTVGEDELFNQLDKKLRDDYISDLESEKFSLEFDTLKSVFYYEGGLSISGITKNPKIYFKEKDSLFSLRPENDPDFGAIIIKENRNTKWELQNETKMIDGYLCYKATSVLVRNNGVHGLFKFPIIAWYTPAIPIPFGPLGYGNLPGLILELQERNILYGITKIKLNHKIDFNKSILYKPSIGKIISSEELSSKIAEMFKNR